MIKKTFCIFGVFFLLLNTCYADTPPVNNSSIDINNFVTNVISQTTTNQTELDSITDLAKITAAPNPAVALPTQDVDLGPCQALIGSSAQGFGGSSNQGFLTQAIGKLCVSTIIALNGKNGVADNINRNFSGTIFKAAKFLSLNIITTTANAIYVLDDIFFTDHGTYLDYFSNLKSNQASADSNINGQLGIVLSLSNDDNMATSEKSDLITTLAKDKTPPLDVNQFYSPPTYTSNQAANAALITRVIKLLSLPPKKIVIDPAANSFMLKAYNSGTTTDPTPVAYDYPTGSSDDSGVKQQKNMTDKILTLPEYLNYNLKRNFSIIARSMNLNVFLRSYFARQSDNNLAQTEFIMATQGLSKDYYTKMASAPIATLALEILRSIKELSYLTYQVHLDNEKLLLLNSVNGLQMNLAASSFLDDRDYDNAGKAIYNEYCNTKYWPVDTEGKAILPSLCIQKQQ